MNENENVKKMWRRESDENVMKTVTLTTKVVKSKY
jgi:hypothetical protein